MQTADSANWRALRSARGSPPLANGNPTRRKSRPPGGSICRRQHPVALHWRRREYVSQPSPAIPPAVDSGLKRVHASSRRFGAPSREPRTIADPRAPPPTHPRSRRVRRRPERSEDRRARSRREHGVRRAHAAQVAGAPHGRPSAPVPGGGRAGAVRPGEARHAGDRADAERHAPVAPERAPDAARQRERRRHDGRAPRGNCGARDGRSAPAGARAPAGWPRSLAAARAVLHASLALAARRPRAVRARRAGG